MDVYFHAGSLPGHLGRIDFVGGNYAFKPVCSCGAPFWGYVIPEAAKSVLRYHLDGLDEHAEVPAAATSDGAAPAEGHGASLALFVGQEG